MKSLTKEELIDRTCMLKKSFPYTGGMSQTLIKELETLYLLRKYSVFVYKVKMFYKIDSPMRIGYIPKEFDLQAEALNYANIRSNNSSNKDSKMYCPGFMILPRRMPMYGTTDFKSFQFSLFVQRWFLFSAFDVFLGFISHELAHIILHSIIHPLRACEYSTDILSMIITGPDNLRHTALNVGYLEKDEIKIVAHTIKN